MGKVDPEVYTRTLTGIFMEYPEWAVAGVVKELQREHQYPPSPKEVTAKLDSVTFRKKWSPPSTPNTFRDDPPIPETTSEYRTNVIRKALGYLPDTCHPVGETDGPGRSSKRVPDRQYRHGKVYEDGKLVSEKFGEWNGQSCIAENDPVRLGAPKGWNKI